jgi:hypothetical protein
MSEDIKATVTDGRVYISLSSARMFQMLRDSGRSYTWTQDWWERNVSPVVFDAMAGAVETGTGEKVVGRD